MLAPALAHFLDAVPGGPVARRDAWQNVWNLWWVARAVTSFQNPFFTPLLYFPEGADLSLQTLNVTNGILALPVTALWGPVAGYNTSVITAFALAGLGAYALALRVSESRAAAFVAGLLFTFSPFHMTKLWDGQLELIALQWLPLYALALLRAVEDRRRVDALLAGLLLALIGYTSWYYFLFFVVYSVAFGLLWLPGSPARARAITQLALAALAGALLLLPVLVPALRAIGVGATPGAPSSDESGPNAVSFLKVIHSADLVDFWLPSALHPLWGAAVTRIGERIHPYIAAWNIALGYVTLLFGLAALAWRRERAWRWSVLALIGIILALGPVLQINGVNTGWLLPYALLTHVPGVDIAHRPSHFVVITVVVCIPLAALGIEALLARFAAGWRIPLVVLVCLLASFELAPPSWTLARSAPEPLYNALAGDNAALIDLPPRLESSAPLEAQMVHGLAMMGGFVSRTPAYHFADDTPVVRDLWAMQPGEQRQIRSGDDDAAVVLNAYNLKHIVIHWADLTAAQRHSLAEVLAQVLPGVRPVYDDGQLTAYRVPDAALRVFGFFRAGWFAEEREGERRWRWMGDQGEIVLVNPIGTAAEVRVQLVAQSYAEARDVELTLNGASAGVWHVERGDSPLAVHLLVPPGTSSLVLRAPVTLEQGRSQRRLSIVVVASSLR
jgi:hypothetical protein